MSGRALQVALSIQGTGEGDIIKGAWGSITTNVLGHAADTVFSLFWGQLPPQLFQCNV